LTTIYIFAYLYSHNQTITVMKTEELISDEFSSIDLTTLPRNHEVDKLSDGCFAQHKWLVAPPSLVFIEKINMHESKSLATIYWHFVNQINGFEQNTWATTYRKESNIAFESGFCWVDLSTIGTARLASARK
jgi:hypothetical protein